MNDSDKSNSIVQINISHVLFSVRIIEIFEIKIVNAINPRVYTSRHYGKLFGGIKQIDTFDFLTYVFFMGTRRLSL